jgi:hypothetical protein
VLQGLSPADAVHRSCIAASSTAIAPEPAAPLVPRCLGESHLPHLDREIGHLTLILVPPTVRRLGRWCTDGEHATKPPRARVPHGDRAPPLAWAGPAKFAAVLSQRVEASGQMEASYYSSIFNF